MVVLKKQEGDLRREESEKRWKELHVDEARSRGTLRPANTITANCRHRHCRDPAGLWLEIEVKSTRTKGKSRSHEHVACVACREDAGRRANFLLFARRVRENKGRQRSSLPHTPFEDKGNKALFRDTNSLTRCHASGKQTHIHSYDLLTCAHKPQSASQRLRPCSTSDRRLLL